MLTSRSLRFALVAAALLLPVLAAAGENPAPAAPVAAPEALMTPVAPETAPAPLFLADTYWCTYSIEDCGRTWSCGKTCQVGQGCECVFLYGQTPEGGCIIRNYGAFCS